MEEELRQESESKFKTWIKVAALAVLIAFVPEQAAWAMGYDPSVLWAPRYYLGSGQSGYMANFVSENVRRSLDSLANQHIQRVEIASDLVVDAKPLSDTIDYRDQRCDISRIARPHLAAHGLTFIVDNGADDHLIQIGPVVFAKPLFSDVFTTLALKVDGCRIEKDHIQSREQIPMIEENRLFDQVFVTPGSKRRGSVLIFDHFSQKGHRSVEMM